MLFFRCRGLSFAWPQKKQKGRRPFNLLDFLNLAAFRNPSRSPCRLDSWVCFTFFFRFAHGKFISAASV
jgi:hypothetical protein